MTDPRLGPGDRRDAPDGRGVPARIVRLVRRDVPLAVIDTLAVFCGYLVPLVLRFDGEVPSEYWGRFLSFIPLAALLHLLCNFLFGLYGQMWRYASVQEARRLALAAVTSLVLVLAFTEFVLRGPRPLPLSVLILGVTFSVIVFGAVRFQSRLFALRRRSVANSGRESVRVLLVGAGEAGAMVLQDILRNPSIGLRPVGFVDDDPRKRGLSLHGVSVAGTRADIPELVSRLDADQVLLAVPSATGEVVRDVAELCERADVPLRVLPSVREIVGGVVSARDIRDLRIEDLLGRQQVRIDLESVRQLLRGTRVLVTGAGGSIGAEITRQVADFTPASLVLLDNDETHLHDLAEDIRGTANLSIVLADVRDRDRLLEEFLRHRPQLVFHAAAHKHVPLLEEHPQEAVMTNVIGTANVVDAAVTTGVERFVLISTDKAVRPVSVMGASKRLAEEIVRSSDGADAILCAVRFGNVLGSRGSVIPTFLRQIQRGGPVTVTDPGMTRFFMSVEEAVRLVLQAAALARGGEVFTLDMGEPVNIMDLARKVIHLAGQVPGRDVPIVVTGRRRGEKVHEELHDDGELPEPTGHPGIVAARPPVPDRVALRRTVHELQQLVTERRNDELSERILRACGEDLRESRADALVAGERS